MEIKIFKKEDGYWLSLDGINKALINIVSNSTMVAKALEEAVSYSEINNSRGFCKCGNMISPPDKCEKCAGLL